MDQQVLLTILILLPCLAVAGIDPNDEKAGKDLPGHMQPLGSHMPPEYVKRVSGLPTPTQFVEQYLHTKQPVIFEGLIKDLDVRKKWADDNYLRFVKSARSNPCRWTKSSYKSMQKDQHSTK